MKPGVKTTEFWVVAVTVAVAALEAVRGEVRGPWAIIVAGAVAGLYALLRTSAKAKT